MLCRDGALCAPCNLLSSAAAPRLLLEVERLLEVAPCDTLNDGSSVTDELGRMAEHLGTRRAAMHAGSCVRAAEDRPSAVSKAEPSGCGDSMIGGTRRGAFYKDCLETVFVLGLLLHSALSLRKAENQASKASTSSTTSFPREGTVLLRIRCMRLDKKKCSKC